MKKLILSAAVIAMALTTVSAQKIGPYVGLNISNMKMTTSEQSMEAYKDSKPITGLNLGIAIEAPIIKSVLFLNTGVGYTQTGYELDTKGISGDMKINNLMIPANLKFILIQDGGFRPFIQAGPYLMCALSGKESLTINGKTVSKNAKFSGDSKDMNRFDVGLNIGTGVEVSNFRLNLNYGLGLTNTYSGTSDLDATNRVVSISLGYMF